MIDGKSSKKLFTEQKQSAQLSVLHNKSHEI